MTSTTLQVAALQTAAHDRSDFDAAWPRILDAASRAVEGGDVDLLVMPEATIPGYVLGGTGIDESATKRAVEQLARLAAGTSTAIVCGAVVRSGEHLRNAAVAIDRDGTIAGRADKTFLWHFDRMWFEAADCIEPIRTSIGTIGALVCADGRIPTIARALVDRGAQILVMPTAWVSSGRDPGALENVQADLLARVRALRKRRPVRRGQQVRRRNGHRALLRQEPTRGRRRTNSRNGRRARARDDRRSRRNFAGAGAKRGRKRPGARSGATAAGAARSRGHHRARTRAR